MRRAVFYNPAMALDRDLSVAVARAWSDRTGRRLRAWEMLSATGVRGLRVLNESGALEALLLTEANPEACRWLERNAAPHPAATVRSADARELPPGSPFDVVDLDPYGTPAPFLPTAIAATAPGGLLAVTATDMPVLAGVQRTACEARYGAVPLHGHFGPEGGLRILIAHALGAAARRGRSARPVLAYVHDHHVRAYLALDREARPAEVARLPGPGWAGPALGEGPYGPMWVGPLFDAGFLRELRAPAGAARAREVAALLDRFREESGADTPFYFEPNRIAGALGLSEPPGLAPLLTRLRELGHAAARSHVRPSAFRTTASEAVVFDVARLLAARRISSSPVR